VGGVFLFSEDPARLAAWYTEHLGLSFRGEAGPTTFYTVFWAVDPDDPKRKLDTSFAIMRAKVPMPPRPAPPREPDDMYGDQSYMLNLRVRDLEVVLQHLASKGVEPIDAIDESYGRFAWVRDADGRRVELYEPRPGEADQGHRPSSPPLTGTP
jgi:catechol 2,3-dioxygenase-like lactoylglutathione lyase family enzyme